MDIATQAIVLFFQVVFATWYVAYSISSTHGPLGVFDRIRNLRGGRWHGRQIHSHEAVDTRGNHVAFKGDIETNGLLDCPICLAPWIALILLVAPYGIVIQALAIAGLAMLLHSASGWRFGHD